MKIVVLLLLLCSCHTIKGPSYQGRSHNEQLSNNNRIVQKEDYRMKKAVIKARAKASGKKAKRIRKRKGRKYIN